MDALKRANEVRIGRAVLKKKVKRGEQSVRALVKSPSGLVDTMKVFDLLLAAPRVGRVRANAHLRRAGVSPTKTLGGLTDRQRRELLSILGGAGVR